MKSLIGKTSSMSSLKAKNVMLKFLSMPLELLIIGKNRISFQCRVESKNTSLLLSYLTKMTFFWHFYLYGKTSDEHFFQEIKFKWLSYEQNSPKLGFSHKMSFRIYFLLHVNFALTFSKAYAQMSDNSNCNMEKTFPQTFFQNY